MTEDANKKGRPTDYDPKYIEEVDLYIADHKDERQDNGKQTVRLPTRDGFAKRIGKPRQTIDNWCKANPEFFDALEKIDIEQKERLVNEGLAGNYNSTIAKLILSANHGMREKTEQDITSKGEQIDGFVLEFIKPKHEANNPNT